MFSSRKIEINIDITIDKNNQFLLTNVGIIVILSNDTQSAFYKNFKDRANEQSVDSLIDNLHNLIKPWLQIKKINITEFNFQLKKDNKIIKSETRWNAHPEAVTKFLEENTDLIKSQTLNQACCLIL